jgi:flagellar protein FliJ
VAFHFKLEILLSYRKILEEQAQQLLAREQKALEEHLRLLTELQAERMGLSADFEVRKGKEKLPAGLFTFYMDQLEYKVGEIRDRHRVLGLQKKSVESARLALAEKVKERKIIERAREKARDDYAKEILRGEQSENDEQVVLRHGR